MAVDDGQEQSIGGWQSSLRSAISHLGLKKPMVATKIGAAVSFEGLTGLVAKTKELKSSFTELKKELQEINSLAEKAGKSLSSMVSAVGSGQDGSVQEFGRMVKQLTDETTKRAATMAAETASTEGVESVSNVYGGYLARFRSMIERGRGQPPSGGGVGGVGGGAQQQVASYGSPFTPLSALMMFDQRFMRNLNESIPISANDMYMASMYGADSYRQWERMRLTALGNYAGTRTDAAAAESMLYQLGGSRQSVQRFMSTVLPRTIQATGGIYTAPEAIQTQLMPFLDPRSLWTQRPLVERFGYEPLMQNGEFRNPRQYALDLFRAVEQMRGAPFTNIEALRNPNNLDRRLTFEMMARMSPEETNLVIEAALQNQQFRQQYGRDIDFNSALDLERLGMSQGRLGLAARKYESRISRREADFFAASENAMVDRLGVEEKIIDGMSKLETALVNLAGPILELTSVIRLAAVTFGSVGSFSMLGGRLGGGGLGGGLPAILGGLGRGGSGAAGAGRLASIAGTVGRGVGAAAFMTGGLMLANNAADRGSIAGVLGSSALAGIGTAMLVGGPAGIAAGLGVATYGVAKLALNSMKKKDMQNVQEGYKEALSMDDATLIASLKSYEKSGYSFDGRGAGPKERGRFDLWADRRAALTAAALTLAAQEGVFDSLVSDEKSAKNLYDVIAFMESEETRNDAKFSENSAKASFFLQKIKSDRPDIYKEFFGDVNDPFGFTPITSNQYRDLVELGRHQAENGGEQYLDLVKAAGEVVPTGDPSTDRGGGSPTAGAVALPSVSAQAYQEAKRRNEKDSSWSGLQPWFQERLLRLFAASDNKIWLGSGGGYRSDEAQTRMFFERYTPNPSQTSRRSRDDRFYQGQWWNLKPGYAPAAAPGRSVHGLGLAADLAGDLNLLQDIAGQFALKTFAGVNNEPWHVQPKEFGNGYDDVVNATGGGWVPSYNEGGGVFGNLTNSIGAIVGAMSGGGGSSFRSGVDFALAQTMGSVFSVGAAIGDTRTPPGMSTGLGGLVVGSATGVGGTLGPSTQGVLEGTNEEIARKALAGWDGRSPLTPEQIATLAYAAGFRGDDIAKVVAIADRESDFNPRVLYDNSNTRDESYGLFQINFYGSLRESRMRMLRDLGLSSPEDLYDPWNAMMAFRYLYNQSGFHPWAGYRPGIGFDDRGGSGLAEEYASAREIVGRMTFPSQTGDPSVGQQGGVAVAVQSPPVVFNNQIRIISSGSPSYDAEALVSALEDKVKKSQVLKMKRSI